VHVDLPQLAEGVGLDEVAFVVHVEPVVDGVALEVSHESRDVDDGHVLPRLVPAGDPPAGGLGHYRHGL
jgi:hypothetical protein